MNKRKHGTPLLLLAFLLSVLLAAPHTEPVQAATPIPASTPMPTSTPIASPIPMQIANPMDNGLFWINEGATYRSGAILQFYAIGAGYGPEEPQELTPTRGSTRYIPASWSVDIQRGADSKTTKKVGGSWKRCSEKIRGHAAGGFYVPGEYRFKSSFTLKTSMAMPIPYTLTTKYNRQTYDGKSWKNDGKASYKSINFYIKNVGPSSRYSEFSIANNSKIEVGDKIGLEVSGVLSKITFTSSNKKVARIGKFSGKITAMGVGKVTITAKAPAFGQYRAFKKSITIKVVPKSVAIKSTKSPKKGQMKIIGASETSGNTGYKIQYKYPGGKVSTIDFKSKKPLNYTIKKLKSGKEYRIRVCAYKKAGKAIYTGYYSLWVSAGKVK